MTGIEQNDYVFIKGGYNTNPKFNYPQLESSKFMGYSWNYKNETEPTPIFNEFEFEMNFVEGEKYEIGYNNELFIDAVKRNVKVYRNIVVEGKSTPNKVELNISKILVPEQTGLFDDGFMLLTLNIDGEKKTFAPTNEYSEKYEWPKVSVTPLNYFTYSMSDNVIRVTGFVDETNIPSKLVMGDRYKIDDFDIMAPEYVTDWGAFPFFEGVDVVRLAKTSPQYFNFMFKDESGILVIPTAYQSLNAFGDDIRSYNVITTFTDEYTPSNLEEVAYINFSKISNNKVINIVNNGDVHIVPSWGSFANGQPREHHTTFNIDINFEKNIANPGVWGDTVVGWWQEYNPEGRIYYDMTVNLIGVSYQDFVDGNANEMIDKMMKYPDIEVNFLPSRRIYEDASINWSFSTDDETNTITLSKYIGDGPNVIIHDGYIVNNSDGETKRYNNVTLAESSNSISDAVLSSGKIRYIRFERGVKLNNNAKFQFYLCNNVKRIILDGIDTSNIVDATGMFYYCKTLEYIDLEKLNTSNVTRMESMFNTCSKLTSLDLSSFDTSKVITIGGMFSGCSGLTSLDLSSFDTSNTLYMQSAFYNCSGLTSLDLSSFNTSNATSIYYLFSGCSSLTSLDLSSFDTSNVTNMQGMFSGCSSLTSLDLSSFDTSNVTSMKSMFSGCSNLISLDLSSFDIQETTTTDDMFANCNLLSTIYVKDETTKARVESSTNFPSTATVIVGSPA